MYKPALLSRREQANKCLLVQTQGRGEQGGLQAVKGDFAASFCSEHNMLKMPTWSLGETRFQLQSTHSPGVGCSEHSCGEPSVSRPGPWEQDQGGCPREAAIPPGAGLGTSSAPSHVLQPQWESTSCCRPSMRASQARGEFRKEGNKVPGKRVEEMAPQQPCRAEGWMCWRANRLSAAPEGTPVPGGRGSAEGAAQAPAQAGALVGAEAGHSQGQLTVQGWDRGEHPQWAGLTRGYCRSAGPGAACVQQPTAPDRAGPIPPRRRCRPAPAPFPAPSPAPDPRRTFSKKAPDAGVVGNASAASRV